MDDADRADAELEALIKAGKAAAQRHGWLPHTGFCHNCGDLAGADSAFCCGECRDDYERRESAKRREGK